MWYCPEGVDPNVRSANMSRFNRLFCYKNQEMITHYQSDEINKFDIICFRIFFWDCGNVCILITFIIFGAIFPHNDEGFGPSLKFVPWYLGLVLFVWWMFNVVVVKCVVWNTYRKYNVYNHCLFILQKHFGEDIADIIWNQYLFRRFRTKRSVLYRF